MRRTDVRTAMILYAPIENGGDIKNNVYACKPQFYYIKVGFNKVKII